MKLVTALALASLAVAAAMIALSAYLSGGVYPYFLMGVVMLAIPPAVIGLLLLAPWPSARTTGGWLALVLGWLWVVAAGTSLLGNISAVVGGSGQQDLVGTLVAGAGAVLVIVLNLSIFWAAVWRDRGSRTSSPSHPASA